MARKKKEQTDTSGQAPRASAKGIIKLPLGKCLTAPNSRFYADLKAAALSLARCRNAMARYWQRWQEDMPFHDSVGRQEYFDDWRHEEGRDADDKALARWQKWVDEGGFSPPAVEYEGRWLSFEGVLYNIGRAFGRTPEGGFPIAHLHCGLITPCGKDVLKDLLAKTSYRHTGAAKYRWQGVLLGEMQLSDYGESLSVPVKNNDSILAWNDAVSAAYGKAPSAQRGAIDRYATDQCVLLLPLFSKQAGRKYPFHVVRINTRYLAEGMKRVLRNIISGQWKFSDSSLHLDQVRPNSRRARKGQKDRWFLHLCYEQVAEESKLDPNREAYLTLNAKEASDPFEVGISAGTARYYEQENRPVPKPWQVGDGQMLKRQFERLERIREEWRYRHRVRGQGRRSHGHAREYRDLRQNVRMGQNVARDAVLKTVAEIVRYCVRHNLGTLDFRLPNLGQRNWTWYAVNNVPMNWTTFADRLKHECWEKGVRLRMKDEPAEVVTA